MAVSAGSPPPPRVWIQARGAALFSPPTQVEVFDGKAYQVSPAALTALAKSWVPGLENDKSSSSGLLRLTLPFSGLLTIMGRAKGDPGLMLADGAALSASILGLDAGHDPVWPVGHDPAWPGAPKGWHPFTARFTAASTSVLLDTKGVKLSLIVVRPTTR